MPKIMSKVAGKKSIEWDNKSRLKFLILKCELEIQVIEDALIDWQERMAYKTMQYMKKDLVNHKVDKRNMIKKLRRETNA